MLWRAGLLIKWALVTALGLAVAVGCGGNPFFAAAGFQIQPGGGTTGGTGGTQPGGGGGSSGLSRFITVHIENLTGQQIHYFLHFFAFAGPGGTIAPEDENEYLNFGYIDTGSNIFTFGSVTVTAPASNQRIFWYYHEMGSFPESSVSQAIGGQPTFDTFFDQLGAQVPVPDLILFYNGEFAADLCLLRSLRVTDSSGAFDFEWLGPLQIQGTGCDCLAQPDDPFQRLAPLTRSESAALCNEYFRGSDIIYQFRDPDPGGAPQRLLWQVTGATGSTIHTFAF